MGLLFLNPVAGAAVGAAAGAGYGAHSGETGIDKDFIQGTADTLKPGTAALFLMVQEGNAERSRPRSRAHEATVIMTTLSEDAEGSSGPPWRISRPPSRCAWQCRATARRAKSLASTDAGSCGPGHFSPSGRDRSVCPIPGGRAGWAAHPFARHICSPAQPFAEPHATADRRTFIRHCPYSRLSV